MTTQANTLNPVKQPLSAEVRQRILELRRTYSLQQVATLTGVALGTVKTICSRSGVFRNNPRHRELFTLPPIIENASREIAIPTMPPRQVATGDKEIDAVLWLQQVVSTGQADMIDKAMQAMKRIKTPLPILEKRYRDMVIAQNPGNLLAALSTFGFGDLQGQAKRAVGRNTLAREAIARFGSESACFNDTPAEKWIVFALNGVELVGGHGLPMLSPKAIAALQTQADYLPHTLSDCLHELHYWSGLYRLRHAVDKNCGDRSPEEWVRTDFVFHLMAKIRPKDKTEALLIMRFMIEDEDGSTKAREGADDILLNLLR